MTFLWVVCEKSEKHSDVLKIGKPMNNYDYISVYDSIFVITL